MTPEGMLHHFEGDERKFLHVDSLTPSPFQRERIERNRYEVALKKYLLIKEYEEKH